MAGTVRFEGKVVVVTGAGGPGTGGAAVRRFASEGAQVVASDIDEQGLENLVKSAEVGHGGRIVPRRCDVTEADDVACPGAVRGFDLGPAGRDDQSCHRRDAPGRVRRRWRPRSAGLSHRTSTSTPGGTGSPGFYIRCSTVAGRPSPTWPTPGVASSTPRRYPGWAVTMAWPPTTRPKPASST